MLMAQAGGGSCTRSGELKLRRKEEDCGKSRQREGIERSRPLRAWPSPSPSTPRPEQSAEWHSEPRKPSLGASVSHLHVVPTHRLAWAFLAGDLLGAPEVDADFACLTPQTLLGVSCEEQEG